MLICVLGYVRLMNETYGLTVKTNSSQPVFLNTLCERCHAMDVTFKTELSLGCASRFFFPTIFERNAFRYFLNDGPLLIPYFCVTV